MQNTWIHHLSNAAWWVALGAAFACVSAPPAPAPAPVAEPPRATRAQDLAQASERFFAGRRWMKEGAHAKALPELEAAVSLRPDWALGQLELARCRQALGQDPAQVEAPLTKALALAPGNPRVHFALGQFHESYGRDAEARAAYRQALALRPSYPEALLRLALLEEVANDHPRALQLFARALALRPGDTAAALGVVRCAEQTGQLLRAEQVLRAMRAKNPGDVRALQALIRLNQKQGRAREVKRLRRKLRALSGRERKLRPLKPSRR